MIIDLVIGGMLAYAAYAGATRGLFLASCELASFLLATVVALAVYVPLGAALTALAHISLSLGAVTAFTLVWIVVEIAAAVAVRWLLLPRVRHHLSHNAADRVGGGILNVAKAVIVVALGLIVLVGLPLPSQDKTAVANAWVPRLILASSGKLQTWLDSGIAGDIGSSLTFYTVDSDPESTERIDLGFTTTGSRDPGAEAAMLVWLNHERTSRGIRPLVLNIKARGVARAHSEDMFARGYFSHINDQGENPFVRMHLAGVPFGAAGENLALAPTLQLAEQGLMNSPPHKANILDPSYKSVGIGIMNGGQYGLMITQDFTDQ